jgi:hypothetical protein
MTAASSIPQLPYRAHDMPTSTINDDYILIATRTVIVAAGHNPQCPPNSRVIATQLPLQQLAVTVAGERLGCTHTPV